MHILGIETSCDDTSVALVERTADNFIILAEKTASQIDIHKKYGGVIPELAGRAHAEKIAPLIDAVLPDQPQPDVIAVTSGPGLITSLLVGVEAAKTLSYLWDIPLIGVNHIAGHIHSVELKCQMSNVKCQIEFPALCLVVSGGHTELIVMTDHANYKRIGATRDDAAGECFDKVASLVGYSYPGGPKISVASTGGNDSAIDFPRPMLTEDNFDFSFSGLKTSALYWLRDHEIEHGNWNMEYGITLADFCASFEQAIVDVLVAKTLRAAEEHKPKSIILAGGVAANKKLRESLQQAIVNQIPNSTFHIPASEYCMDNAAMIAAAGYYLAAKTQYTPWSELVADPNWQINF